MSGWPDIDLLDKVGQFQSKPLCRPRLRWTAHEFERGQQKSTEHPESSRTSYGFLP